MSEEERPRKSWREIDKQKDKSRHRQDERTQNQRQKTGPRSQHAYRAALDKLFETGKIAELVEQKAPGTVGETEGGESRIKMLAKIKNAIDRKTITEEIDAYLQKYELPDDLEVLGKVLEHRNLSLQLQAMERIDQLLDHQQPKRSRAMIGQLKLIRDVGDEKELVDLASKLIQRLE